MSRSSLGNLFLALAVLAAIPAWGQLKICAPVEDIPDAAFIDANCDGIDGDIAKSFFVAPSGSNANPGTMAQPFATIGRGITAAAADPVKKHVLVAAGTYTETVTLQSGVSLFGMYDAALWQRSPQNLTTIVSPTDTALIVTSYSGDGYVEGFQLIAANAASAGGSSYGVRLLSVTGNLRIRYNVIRPGHGANGTAGARGIDGRAAGNGTSGEPGCQNSGTFCGICARPLPGNGGTSPAGNPASRGGFPGLGDGFGETAPNAPNGGGQGGRGGFARADGEPGLDGAQGVNGAHGAGGQSGITLSNGLFIPWNGNNGGDGTNGLGAGGGGGGGGGTNLCDSYGSAGGGGGGGGERGTGGKGGTGGGGSIGILAHFVGGGSLITDNVISPRSGGNGGNGGDRAFGGRGGLGGGTSYGGSGEQDDGGMGGVGGWGGFGGTGGWGGGGAGGPSWGILYHNSSAPVAGNVVDLSQSLPGMGGFSPVNNGQPGTKGSSETPNAASVPTPPVNVTATAASGSAQVFFRAPLSTGNSPITSYTAVSNPDGITGISIGSPIAVTGLTNGVAYTFTVIAANAVGNSAASAPSNPAVPHARAALDLNGDAHSDLLWRNAASGQVYRMLMSGFAIGPSAIVHTEPDAAWAIVSDGDFNGDGIADLLWRNSANGQLFQMIFNASGTVASGIVFYTEPNAAWQVAQTPDLDGDGRSDLVWWNSDTGQVYYMLMDGPTIRQQGFIYQEPDTNWRIVTSGDFSGSGRQNQLVWHNLATGAAYLMTLNVAGVAGQPPVSGALFYLEPDTAWKVIGAADFNGDGKSDLLWKHQSTGQTWVMLMNGSTITSQGAVYTEPNPAWRIAALGDYDGDGKGDIAWFNDATGQVFMMLMDGLATRQSAIVYQETNPDWDLLGPAINHP